LLKQDLFCRGYFSHSEAVGLVFLEVIPSSSGLAELDIRLDGVKVALLNDFRKLFCKI
jgi:hypothetical protein